MFLTNIKKTADRMWSSFLCCDVWAQILQHWEAGWAIWVHRMQFPWVEGKSPSCWQLGDCVIENLPLWALLKVTNPVSIIWVFKDGAWQAEGVLCMFIEWIKPALNPEASLWSYFKFSMPGVHPQLGHGKVRKLSHFLRETPLLESHL